MLLTLIYRALYKLHHGLLLRPGKPLTHAKLIVVGSFLAGGAGKTPFVIWLANHIISLSETKKVAVLCHAKARDELELLKAKLPWATVVASSNRYRTARDLDRQFDYIICDDGFEDTRLRPAYTVRLDWGEPPRRLRDLWPVGPNRSLVQDHPQPDLVLKCYGENPDVKFAIAEIVNGVGEHLDAAGSGIWAVCGIGNPERFFRDLENFGVKVEKTVVRPDHDWRYDRALKKILKSAPAVLVTEKDFMRLGPDLRNSPRVYRCVQDLLLLPLEEVKI
jgi:tetraacyldisaccharide 4'-kinase